MDAVEQLYYYIITTTRSGIYITRGKMTHGNRCGTVLNYPYKITIILLNYYYYYILLISKIIIKL